MSERDALTNSPKRLAVEDESSAYHQFESNVREGGNPSKNDIAPVRSRSSSVVGKDTLGRMDMDTNPEGDSRAVLQMRVDMIMKNNANTNKN